VRRRRRRRGRARRRWARRGLFWRVYTYGILLLVALAASFAVANALTWGGGGASGERLATYVARTLSPMVERPAELTRALGELHDVFEVDLAVYGSSGRLIARAGEAPPPLDRRPEKPAWRQGGGRPGFVVPLQGAYLVGVGQHARAGRNFFGALFLVLFVLAAVSFPFARGIARPLEKLTATAKAFGGGDLDARTGICRRDEVGTLASAFDEMAERVQRSIASEKELLANVSHELRTPLARIRVALELAEEEPPERLADRLAGIGVDLAELETLIEDVLSAARLDLGHEEALRPKREPVDVAAFVAEAASRFGDRHPERSVEVTRPEEPFEVDLDPRLMHRLVGNLLDNAAKYADDDPIELAVDVGVGGLTLEVRDRGIGVAEPDLERLFEPFFRTDRSRQRGTGGVGLGLTLCRRVAEAHGGSIRARSRDGGGLVVAVTLPSPAAEKG
jgi:signal transduction histidine kinase